MLFFSTLMAFVGSALLALAVPTFRGQYLIAGLPLPSNVSTTAGGGIPNAAIPRNISSTAIAGFQTANYLENMEAVFFNAGFHNLTTIWNTTSYPANTLTIVSKVAAQEQVHVATIETLLTTFNATTMEPCTYRFPATDPASFLTLASVITTVGLGAVNALTSALALTDPLLIPSTTSILSVESRHDAFFRSAGGGLVPNPAPFDTRLSPLFAYNLARPFIIQGSCFNILPYATLPSLTIIPSFNGSSTGPTFPNATAPPLTSITFTFDTDGIAQELLLDKPLYAAWVNQANKPAYTLVTLLEQGKGVADVPAGVEGMAFVVLTLETGAEDVDQLSDVTLAGPAVVMVS